MRSLLTASLAFALLTGAGCDRGDHPQQLNTPAPSFEVTDGHRSANLAKLRGKVVLLNFWASWCAPCLEELPSMKALHQQIPQLEIIGVSMDEDPAAYQRFLDAHHVDFLTVLDPKAENGVNLLYGSTRPPETFLIDKNGVIRRKFIGPQEWTSPEILKNIHQLGA